MEFLEIMGIFGLVLLVKHTGPGFRLQKVAQIVPLLKAVLIQVNFFSFIPLLPYQNVTGEASRQNSGSALSTTDVLR